MMPSARRAPRLAVVLLDRQRRRRVSRARLRGVLEAAAEALGVSGELALVLGGDQRLRGLNARYRGKDKPTDVLSFPGACARHQAGSAARARCPACSRGEPDLGDIVISVDTAARNARELGRSLPRELDVLALHGFLHVLGYDHETDDGTMDRLEQRLRRRLFGRRTPRGRGMERFPQRSLSSAHRGGIHFRRGAQ
jgi:probable rRNA maturation factor